MTAPLQLAGRRFGRLTVTDYSEPRPGGRRYWRCVCDCGAVRMVAAMGLACGKSKSCGCLRADTCGRLGKRTHLANARNGAAKAAAARTRHGGAVRGGTPTYGIWEAMIQRCTNPRAPGYSNYGGRGISVCERWRDYPAFLADMGEKPPLLSIDRLDVNGDYEPGNCRWATAKEQARNTRRNVILAFGGERLCVSEWAERTGLSRAALSARLRRGWPVGRALTTPSGRHHAAVA